MIVYYDNEKTKEYLTKLFEFLGLDLKLVEFKHMTYYTPDVQQRDVKSLKSIYYLNNNLLSNYKLEKKEFVVEFSGRAFFILEPNMLHGEKQFFEILKHVFQYVDEKRVEEEIIETEPELEPVPTNAVSQELLSLIEKHKLCSTYLLDTVAGGDILDKWNLFSFNNTNTYGLPTYNDLYNYFSQVFVEPYLGQIVNLLDNTFQTRLSNYNSLLPNNVCNFSDVWNDFIDWLIANQKLDIFTQSTKNWLIYNDPEWFKKKLIALGEKISQEIQKVTEKQVKVNQKIVNYRTIAFRPQYQNLLKNYVPWIVDMPKSPNEDHELIDLETLISKSDNESLTMNYNFSNMVFDLLVVEKPFFKDFPMNEVNGGITIDLYNFLDYIDKRESCLYIDFTNHTMHLVKKNQLSKTQYVGAAVARFLTDTYIRRYSSVFTLRKNSPRDELRERTFARIHGELNYKAKTHQIKTEVPTDNKNLYDDIMIYNNKV